jgi:GTP cyclohydrolase I
MVAASLDAQDGAPGKAELQQRIQRMGDSVRVLLLGLGEDVSREGLRDTPQVRAPCAGCGLV